MPPWRFVIVKFIAASENIFCCCFAFFLTLKKRFAIIQIYGCIRKYILQSPAFFLSCLMAFVGVSVFIDTAFYFFTSVITIYRSHNKQEPCINNVTGVLFDFGLM
jgi:hypothetical protein